MPSKKKSSKFSAKKAPRQVTEIRNHVNAIYCLLPEYRRCVKPHRNAYDEIEAKCACIHSYLFQLQFHKENVKEFLSFIED
jgi:hypothetical protein